MKNVRIMGMIIFLVVFLLISLNWVNHSCWEDQKTQMDSENKIFIKINEHEFQTSLFHNETTQALLQSLPLHVQMNELNGNEIYTYLKTTLPSNAQKTQLVHAGDIMLFDDDCLVIFYKDFQTSYQYTPIGKIENISVLRDFVSSNQKINLSIQGDKE